MAYNQGFRILPWFHLEQDIAASGFVGGIGQMQHQALTAAPDDRVKALFETSTVNRKKLRNFK